MFQAEDLTLIAELQRSKRRWKILAFGLLAVMTVLLFVVILSAFFVWSRMKAQQLMATEARERAEQIWQEARQADQRATGIAENRRQKQPMEATPEDLGSLPDVSFFQEHSTERFLVDFGDFTSGHPFKGVNAAQPHAGAHINFDNSGNRWPEGGNAVTNYPPIYAVADGVISRVDFRFGQKGGNDRYGLDLTFARDGKGKQYRLCYSIEPMIPEPSVGFYRPFLVVTECQRVRKGDVVAYMYCPPGVKDVHIHFHMTMDGKQEFLAPTIFSSDVVRQFHATWGGFGRDGDTPMPPCMGYRIGAEENPFGTGAKERL